MTHFRKCDGVGERCAACGDVCGRCRENTGLMTQPTTPSSHWGGGQSSLIDLVRAGMDDSPRWLSPWDVAGVLGEA